MFSITTILTILKTMFTVLAEQVELAETALLLPFSPLKVSIHLNCTKINGANYNPDAKQARELMGILQEAKQNVDPRLAEMGRYSGGGGGGRGYGGRGGYRGGRGGRGGGGYTGSNDAPLGRSRW